MKNPSILTIRTNAKLNFTETIVFCLVQNKLSRLTYIVTLGIVFLLFQGLPLQSYGQQSTVFTDAFSTNQNTSWTTSGIVSSSSWSVLRSGNDWGGRRNSSPAQLELTNDVGATANSNGWVLSSTSTTSFSSPYNAILSDETGIVTWTFNMRQITTDPGGFASGSYGLAFILAGESTTNNTTGNGYAVVLGQSGTTDPVRLVSYASGLQGTLTNLISSNTSGLTDFGAQYLSVKVTYNPLTNTWELFLRNDGITAFADPATGTLVTQGTSVNGAYTSTSLGLMGAYWQGATGASQTAFFDNTTVTVGTSPFLHPSVSTIAFGYQGNTSSSLSQSFSLTAANLTGAPGTLTVTAPSQFQVSTDNSTWGSTASIAYSSATIPATSLFVRFAPTTTGVKSGNITFSGGGLVSPSSIGLSGTSVTYKTWDGSSSSSWNTAANWTPSGVPVANDAVLFNTSASVSVDATPAQLSSITLGSSATVTFTSSGGARAITLSNAGTALDIQAGSSLTLAGSTGSGTRSMDLGFTGSGNTASIAGSLVLTNVGEGTSYDATSSVTTVSGTLKNDGSSTGTAGTITSTALNLIFANGGNYLHALNGGTIPTASWNSASTCSIIGMVATTPAGLAQSFGNFTWNCSGQTGSVSTTGNMIVKGDFTLTAGTFRLNNNTSYTLTIGGNYIQNGGIFNFNSGSSGSSTIYLAGDLVHTASASTLTRTGVVASGNIIFNKNGLQTVNFTNALGADWVKFTINAGSTVKLLSNISLSRSSTATYTGEIIVNGSLDLGIFTITQSGGTTGNVLFTLNSGATLLTANATGLNAISSTNITRTFSTGANYVFNGAGAQTSGSSLPLSINSLTVGGTANLSFNNGLTFATPLVVGVLGVGALNINSGASLSLSSSQALTVDANLTNNAGNSGLVLASGSSLITNSVVNGPATVERNIANDWKWHFLSSPVSSQSIWPEFAPDPGSGLNFGTSWNWDFYYWNSKADTTTALFWVNLRKQNGDYNNDIVDKAGSYAGFGTATPPEMTVGRGYLVAYNTGWKSGSPTTHSFTGTLNSGPINRALLLGANSFNLVGNPYASAIDWKASSGWNRSSLVLRGGGYDYWIFNDNAGNYGVFNSAGSSGTNGTSQYIASGQAFFVRTSADGTLGMTNSVRVHNSQSWLKGAESDGTSIRLKLSTEANAYSDEMIVEFNPEYSGEGSEKFWSLYNEAPEIYAQKNGESLSIDRYPAVNSGIIVNVNTKAGIAGNYMINSSNINEFTLSDKVYLEDLKTGVVTNLKANPSYSFVGNPDDNRNRFRLLIGTATGIKEIAKGNFRVYAFNNEVIIENSKLTGDYKVLVSNLVGQTIYESESTDKSVSRINLDAQPGVYVVSVISNGERYSAKIVLQ